MHKLESPGLAFYPTHPEFNLESSRKTSMLEFIELIYLQYFLQLL